jgi:hypothetical protein
VSRLLVEDQSLEAGLWSNIKKSWVFEVGDQRFSYIF